MKRVQQLLKLSVAMFLCFVNEAADNREYKCFYQRRASPVYSLKPGPGPASQSSDRLNSKLESKQQNPDSSHQQVVVGLNTSRCFHPAGLTEGKKTTSQVSDIGRCGLEPFSLTQGDIWS